MTKIYTVPEIKQRLAKHIRDTINRVAEDIQDLAKREQFKFEALAKTGEFNLAPPAPGSEPIQGGAGIPPGQLNQTMTPPAAEPINSGPIDPNVGSCPLCGMEDKPGSCTCLASRVPGPAAMPVPAPAPVEQASAPLAMSEGDLCKTCGMAKSMCKCMAKGADGAAVSAPMNMAEANPGANGEPSKAQPSKPIDGAKLPPESTKSIKSATDNKPKKNPLGKEEPAPGSREQIWGDKDKADKAKASDAADSAAHSKEAQAVRNGTSGKPWLGKGAVPMAKPPGGGTPGGGANPPMASNTSKPSLGKAAVPANPVAAMKQHALAAAPVPGPAAAPAAAAPLTHPANMGRANAHTAALGGAFAPPAGKPPVSGLSLAPPKPAPAPGVAGPTGPKPVSGLALAPKAPPMKLGVAGPAHPKPVSGLQLARSEMCPFCRLREHRGDCTKK